MKRNDITALHTMAAADLHKKLEETVAVLVKSRLEKKVGKIANKRLVTNLADDVARIKTVLRQKELGK
jgi:ribosomal protein L29